MKLVVFATANVKLSAVKLFTTDIVLCYEFINIYIIGLSILIYFSHPIQYRSEYEFIDSLLKLITCYKMLEISEKNLCFIYHPQRKYYLYRSKF